MYTTTTQTRTATSSRTCTKSRVEAVLEQGAITRVAFAQRVSKRATLGYVFVDLDAADNGAVCRYQGSRRMQDAPAAAVEAFDVGHFVTREFGGTGGVPRGLVSGWIRADLRIRGIRPGDMRRQG